MRCWLRFQRSDYNALVQWITRNNLAKDKQARKKMIYFIEYVQQQQSGSKIQKQQQQQQNATYLPVMEYRQTECLTLCMRTQIGFEAE